MKFNAKIGPNAVVSCASDVGMPAIIAACCIQPLHIQEALLLQRDRATLLLVQILLTHDGGIYHA